MRDVGRPVCDRVVGVWVGEPAAGTADQHDAQAELFGGPPAEQRQLAASTGGAVEPQHRISRGITELGVAEAAAAGQVEAAFGTRLLDARDAVGVPHQTVHGCHLAD